MDSNQEPPRLSPQDHRKWAVYARLREDADFQEQFVGELLERIEKMHDEILACPDDALPVVRARYKEAIRTARMIDTRFEEIDRAKKELVDAARETQSNG